MKKHDYLDTSLWYKEKIKDPFQVIAEAFSFAEISFYRKLITRVLHAASSEKVYSKCSPSNLLFEMKMLESVINAAYLIYKERRKSPLLISSADLQNRNLYYTGRPGTEYDDMPKSLSQKEFMNPYLVFKRSFKRLPLDKLKGQIEEIVEYSLSAHAYDDIEIDCLSLYLQLNKIVEAAHLIDVREIIHVDGHLKNRLKTTY
ncbi:hypothetical protein [Chitinophaga sp. 212800010-3]|uniref:hypothetical protein n=1 Tax=unclassified Chitinophaga TaxID=2619133 RepID=UPI002DE72E30|nr:DNA phosphorothioation-dependent restriction protein DptG [Chitinophaga sp. 212800010-3]